MVVNMNMRGSEKGNINQYLADTISNVFFEVYTVDVAGSTNRELFASNNSEMLKIFAENIDEEDDKAPVELLGMQVIDELIMDEVEYYRGIFEKEGIHGLLEQLL